MSDSEFHEDGYEADADLQSQMQDLQEAHESAAGKLGRAEQKIAELERSNEQLEAVNGISVEDLQAENQYLRQQLEKAQEKRDMFARDSESRLTQEMDDLRKDIRSLRERNQQVNEENLRLRDELRDIRARSDERERRLRNFYNNKLTETSTSSGKYQSDAQKYSGDGLYSDTNYSDNKYTTESKYNDISLVNGDKYGHLSSDRLNRLDEDDYGPLSSTHNTQPYYSSKLADHCYSFDGNVRDEFAPSPPPPPRDDDPYYDRRRRSRSRDRLEPAFTPDVRHYKTNYELENVSTYYNTAADDLSRDVGSSRDRRPRSTSRQRRSRSRYDDDSDSSTSSILEQVERELGYLRSDSRGRSRSLDSRGSRRHRSTSPGDTALTSVGYRSISPAPLITQHNKATLGYPSRKSQLSTSGKRPFAPRSAADVKSGDIVKFSRQNGKISRGLVKFVGHLPGRNDIYLGLELENEDGKHDGTYNGQRFFSCKHNKGVFVTFSKVVMVWG